MRPGTLWVPQRLANALIQNGFGKTIEECLKRVIPLPKSATSLAKDRPKAVEHFDSIEVQAVFSEPKEILLVDDVGTRGATFLGAVLDMSQNLAGKSVLDIGAWDGFFHLKQNVEVQAEFLLLIHMYGRMEPKKALNWLEKY
jgi:hypothetical protein